MEKCNKCSGSMEHTVEQGRGLGKKRGKHDTRKISILVKYDVYTCQSCGEIKREKQ
jgi:hypothetical protein